MEYRIEYVKDNSKVCENIYKLSIKGKFEGNPGQFYMLRAWDREPLLSRPISIYSIDEDCIEFLYAVVGEGTEILSRLKEGDSIKLTGPLGNYFPVNNLKGKVAVVSGGIGIAPMHEVVKRIKDCEIDFYCGFRDEIYGVEEYKPFVDNISISTESGKYGYKGYVTEIINPEKYDVVLCCGPEIMMKKVVDMCKKVNVPVYVSMEKHMACGVGACLVCTCKTKHGNKRTCKDGPVFLGEDLEE